MLLRVKTEEFESTKKLLDELKQLRAKHNVTKVTKMVQTNLKINSRMNDKTSLNNER